MAQQCNRELLKQLTLRGSGGEGEGEGRGGVTYERLALRVGDNNNTASRFMLKNTC